MKARLAALTVLALSATPSARADQAGTDLRAVAPALQHYSAAVLEGDLWKRPELSPRDRSVATVSALIAMGRTGTLAAELNRALDNGVKPAELGAIMTHLAFYAGWPNALSAVGVAKPIFAGRGFDAAQLEAPGELLPLDRKADQLRAAGVEKAYGAVSPAIVRYTNDILFDDLWRRRDLSPRDRSLVTISALIAGGHAEQLPFHLGRGLDNGLSRAQIGEIITQLAFYAGWPAALSAVPVAEAVFDSRPE